MNPLTTLGGLQVFALLFPIAGLITWALMRAAAMSSRREEARPKTYLRNDCPLCHRVETYGAQVYDPDLGWYFTNRFDICWSCRAHRGDAIEIDLDAFLDADAIRVHLTGLDEAKPERPAA